MLPTSLLCGLSASLLMRNNSLQVGHFGGGGGADQGMTLSCSDWRPARRNYQVCAVQHLAPAQLTALLLCCQSPTSLTSHKSQLHKGLYLLAGRRDAVFRVTIEMFDIILMILTWLPYKKEQICDEFVGFLKVPDHYVLALIWLEMVPEALGLIIVTLNNWSLSEVHCLLYFYLC